MSFIQNVQGEVSLPPQAKSMLDLINLYGGEQSTALRSAVYEMEDPETRPRVASVPWGDSKEFLGRLGESAQDVAVDVLKKYLEAKFGL